MHSGTGFVAEKELASDSVRFAVCLDRRAAVSAGQTIAVADQTKPHLNEQHKLKS